MQNETPVTVRASTTGACSHPVALPATTRWHRGADRLLRAVYALGTVGLVAVVLAGFLVAALLPESVGIWLAGILYLAVGGYCSLNFWRCREAHCIVTGIGFTVLGLAVLAAAVGARTVVFEHEGSVLLGVLAAAIAFEAAWRWRHGSNVVRRR